MSDVNEDLIRNLYAKYAPDVDVDSKIEHKKDIPTERTKNIINKSKFCVFLKVISWLLNLKS